MTGRGRLGVVADLQLVVDGHRASLTGSGSELVMRSDDPAALWLAVVGADLPSGLGRVSGPRAVGRLADQLAGQGLGLSIEGPAGVLVRIGQDSYSTAGRLTTKSRSVRLGSPRAVAPVLIALVRQTGSKLWRRLPLHRGSKP